MQLTCIEDFFAKIFNRFFTKLAKLNYYYPWRSIVISLTLVLCCASGFARISELREPRSEKLWVPQDSLSFTHTDLVTEWFGADPLPSSVLWTVDSGSVLDPDLLENLLDFEDKAYALTVVGKDGQPKAFTDLCLHTIKADSTTPCVKWSLLGIWQRNATLMRADLALSGAASRIAGATPSSPFLDENGYPVHSPLVLGGSEAQLAMSPPSYTAVKTTIFLDPSQPEEDVDAWEVAFLELCESWQPPRPLPASVRRLRFTSSSIESELNRGIAGLIPLVTYGITLIGFFLVYAMWRCDKVRNRLSLAVAGLTTILLSVGGGLGLGMLLGAQYTPITLIVIFLVLGIGVDDIILLVTMWDDEGDVAAAQPQAHGSGSGSGGGGSESDPILRRNVAALSKAGAFITLTSATTVLAFVVGSFSAFPAVTHFCVSAACVLLFCFFLVVTAFDAMLVLNAKRVAAGRQDLLCCRVLTSPNTDTASVATGNGAVAVANGGNSTPISYPPNRPLSLFDRAVACYARVLMHPVVRAVVLLFFSALLAASVYGFTQLQEGLDTQELVPDDSYVTPFVNQQELSFAHLGESLGFYFPNPTLPRDLPEIERVTAELEALSHIVAPTRSPFRALADFTATPFAPLLLPHPANVTTAAQYSGNLAAFLATPFGAPYRSAVKFHPPTSGSGSEDGSGGLWVVKVATQHKLLQGSNAQRSALLDTRAVASASSVEVVVFARMYIFWESYTITRREALGNLVYSGVVVFGVLTLMLHPGCVLLITSVVASMDVCLVAWITLAGMRLNSVTTVCLVLSVGIAVDYSAHMAHAFLTQPGSSRSQRAAAAVAQMTKPLLAGGLSTFLGVVGLAAAASATNRVFFKMLAGTVCIGVLHGLVLLPVLLSFIGPAAAHAPHAAPRGAGGRVAPGDVKAAWGEEGGNNSGGSKRPPRPKQQPPPV